MEIDSQVCRGTSRRARVGAFVWQHIWLLASLFVMTTGVALCVRSHLGSSVISSIPYVMTLAGDAGTVPALTIGEYTYIMNAVFVAIQLLVLRRRFEPVQLFQLIVGFFFGALLDISMAMTAWLECKSLASQIITQFIGCTVMGVGIAFEIRCKSITMPGEGITVAFSQVTGIPFPKMKIIIDTTLVAVAILTGYMIFGTWPAEVVGFGTLFAMVYAGMVVKAVNPHIAWFDRLLGYRPGLRRYVYGLARLMTRSKQ